MYLVTGCTGFIGSHLIKKLILEGCNVCGIDNIDYHSSDSLNYYRLKDLEYFVKQTKNRGKFFFYKIDIKDNDLLNNLFKEKKFKKVIHLAALTGVRSSTENAKSYLENNILGFYNVINLCKLYDVEHFIYASSSSVYNNLNNKLSKESNKTDKLFSIYSCTKKTNELIAHTYNKLYNLKSTGLRFFSVYGPFGRFDMSYFKFTNSIYHNKPLLLSNKGTNMRDFTYIDDVTHAIKEIVIKKIKKDFEIYNLGSGNPVSIIKIIKKLELIIGKQAKISYVDSFIEDALITAADTKLIQADYRVKFNTTIDNGLIKFVEWFKYYQDVRFNKHTF
tara:strand:- start:615 stop:1613 length:999 start_codon:yes stop_codon:yes gene_type:complete